MHRDISQALAEARFMVETIHTPDDQLTLEQRQTIAKKTVDNFRDHINKGFLSYRKSVTEAGDFAFTEWQGEGSVMRDVLGREFIDILGGFGLYSPGIRHPKIVAAVKAQLDRSPQYSQEMLDPLRAQLAKDIALLTPGDLQNGFFANSGTEAVDGAMKLRNRVVERLGLKNLGELSAIDVNKPERDYRVGERLGIFTIEHISPNELILGDKDKHLNVRLSLLVQNAGQMLTISTVVHEHNWLGRVYMWFVAPMHRIIAPSVLKRFGA